MRQVCWLLGVGAIGALSVLAQPDTAQADTVTLNNGREIHGRLVEELPLKIRMRTSGGVITILKIKIATFSENENWGNYSKPRSVAQLAEIEAKKKAEVEAVAARRAKAKARAGGGDDGGPKAGGAKPSKGGGTTPGKKAEKGEWTWGADVTAEKIKELEPVRDKYLEEREKLGKTKAERLAEIELSGEEKKDVKARVRMMGWIRGRGRRGGQAGSSTRRQNAKKELVSKYGVRAIPALIESLGSASLWQVRTSGEGLAEIMSAGKSAEDTRWLMHNFEAMPALLRLMDNEGDTMSAHVRAVGNMAMMAVTGDKAGWPQGATDELRNRGETKAYRSWQQKVKKAKAKFVKDEKAKVTRRAEIEEALEKLRKGENPDAKEAVKEGEGK
jgi:hypothetical protein